MDNGARFNHSSSIRIRKRNHLEEESTLTEWRSWPNMDGEKEVYLIVKSSKTRWEVVKDV